jgi:acyl-CoA thioesterase I
MHAARIFDRLRIEHGFAGGYTAVKDYVRLARTRSREVFVPLARPPGHVQASHAGVSGDTASGGQARLDWALGDGADGVILELGANDMLRGVDPEVTKAALDAILGELKARNIKALIAGMKAVSSLGQDYKTRFDAIYPGLAKKYDAPLYPFFLEGVAGDPALKLGDGLHPNPAGVERIVKGILPNIRAFVDQFGAKAARSK